MSYQNYVVTCNLVADPRCGVGKSGNPYASFRVAISNGKDASGEPYPTTFINASAFGKTAEIVQEHLKKGSKALIVGSIRPDEWTDKEGNKRNDLQLNCFRVEPIAKGAGASADPSSSEDDDLPF